MGQPRCYMGNKLGHGYREWLGGMNNLWSMAHMIWEEPVDVLTFTFFFLFLFFYFLTIESMHLDIWRRKSIEIDSKLLGLYSLMYIIMN